MLDICKQNKHSGDTFDQTHFFLVIREKKQLVRDLSKIAFLMICHKNILFQIWGLCKRGLLMVSYDHIYDMGPLPVLTKIICLVKSFNVLTTDFFKIDFRALILIKFGKGAQN